MRWCRCIPVRTRSIRPPPIHASRSASSSSRRPLLRRTIPAATPAPKTCVASKTRTFISSSAAQRAEHEAMIKESTLDPLAARYRRTVPAGEYWFDRVARGERFRIVDVKGNQAADTLLFSAEDPGERYSFVDTLRAQSNVYLSVGSRLLST